MGFARFKLRLGDRHPELPGIERDLSDKPRCTIGAIGLRGRASQSLAITDQLVEILVLTCDLSEHPLPQQGEQLLKLHPFKQVEEGGITGGLGQLQIEGCAEGLVMALGKTLEIPGAAAATEDAKDRHQQQ